MPLQRSPPGSLTSDEKEENVFCPRSTICKSGSTPKLTDMESDNITYRHKRGRDNSSLFMEEIRSLLSESNAKSDAKFTALQSSMAEIIAQNAEIKEAIAFTSKQYDDMLVQLQQLESERKSDRVHIQQLEEKVDNLERMLYSSKIEIRNIPRKSGENKDDLHTIITKVGNILETPIQCQDIKDVFRVTNKDSKSSAIIVDLNSVTIKENLLKKCRQFNNKNKQNKLNLTHFNIEGPPKPVYLSEKLAPKTQRLFYVTRNFAKDNSYKYCWTSYGRVFLRQDDGKQQLLIKSENDLNNLQQAK